MNTHKRKTNIQNVFPLLILTTAFLQACGGGGGGGGGAPAAGLGTDPNQMCSQAMNVPSGFFEEIDSAQGLPSPDEDVKALRYRYVKADIEALKAALQNKASRIRLDLFSDKSADVLVEGIQKLSEKNYVMTGRLAEDLLSSVSLVVNDDVVVANVHPSNGARYMIQFHGDKTHSISEIDDQDHEQCEAESAEVLAASLQEDPTDSGLDKTDEDLSNPAMAATENEALAAKPVIDMLVAYTPAARSKVGGAAAMKALIQMGVADTNRSFASSGVNLAARLVGTMEVRQNDTNAFSSNLSALKGTSDGRWDEVHARRRQLGADQVTLVGVYPNNGTNGIGYIGAGYSKAFSIAKVSSFGAYSFTHELGHNVGLNHSDGYLNSSGRFRTIMSYGGVTRIRRFSNPSITFNGYRTGDSDQNSARILNARGNYLSTLTAMKIPLSSSDIPYAPPEGSGEICQ